MNCWHRERPAHSTLRCARAGHDLPLLVRPGASECMTLAAQGTALGMLPHIRLEAA